MSDVSDTDLFLLEDKLWLAVRATGVPHFDFRFHDYFQCRHPWQPPRNVSVVLRMGAVGDYEARYANFASEGPDPHTRAILSMHAIAGLVSAH